MSGRGPGGPAPAPTPGGRRLIVWRHGETAHNVGGLWQGQLDTELSPRGLEQARAAAQALAATGPDLIRTSDLLRAASTAAALEAATGLTASTDERLREIHVGAWQGLSQGDVAERFPDDYQALLRGEDVVRGGTGESEAHVRERTREAVEDLLDELAPGETAVLTTHGVTARTLVADLIGMPPEGPWRWLAGLRNCHWAELAEQRTGWRLVAWNVGVTDSVVSTSDR